jgi:4-amino-4-deoxy-L-arabinose transferase-like glycosyltransferase
MSFSHLFNRPSTRKYVLIALILLGVFLRFFRFGTNPRGLNQDEVSIGYESYSLLKTQNDRWGVHLPVYFISWGSGQNTLYAYLSVPFVSAFGLNQFSIRLLSAVLGLLTVLLVYLLIQTLFRDNKLSWLCTVVYLFDPWHFMVSRWAFEENIIPFFILLSLFSIVKGLAIAEIDKLSCKQKVMTFCTFLPLPFLFYSYAMSLFVVPPFLVLLLLFYKKQFAKHFWRYAFSFGLFLFISSPFLLFVLKNNILHHALPFENYLPFSVPEMLTAREQLWAGKGVAIKKLYEALLFMSSGFNDRLVYNVTLMGTPHLFLIFGLVSVVYLIQDNYKNKKNSAVLLLWALASMLVFPLFWMNINRSIHLQSVVPVLAAMGLYFVINKVVFLNRKLIFLIAGLFFCIQTGTFMTEYFIKYPTYCSFVIDYDKALKIAQNQRQPNEKIAITPTLVFNYVYTAFYSKFDPAQFQKSNWVHQNGRALVYSFGNFIIMGDSEYWGTRTYPQNMAYLSKQKSHICILQKHQKPTNGKFDVLYEDDRWRVLRCYGCSEYSNTN